MDRSTAGTFIPTRPVRIRSARTTVLDLRRQMDDTGPLVSIKPSQSLVRHVACVPRCNHAGHRSLYPAALLTLARASFEAVDTQFTEHI